MRLLKKKTQKKCEIKSQKMFYVVWFLCDSSAPRDTHSMDSYVHLLCYRVLIKIDNGKHCVSVQKRYGSVHYNPIDWIIVCTEMLPLFAMVSLLLDK